MFMLRICLAMAMLCGGAAAAQGAAVTATLKGLEIDAGAAGKFILDWPQLVAGKERWIAQDVVVGEDAVVMKYEQGGQATIHLREGGLVQIHFTGVPEAADTMRLRSSISGGIRGALRWSANDGPPAEVPVEYGGNPFLFQGNANRFSLSAVRGEGGFAIVMPHGFQQFQDNREWNSDRHEWFSLIKLPWAAAGEAYVVVAITAPEAPAPKLEAMVGLATQAPQPAIQVDRFGQFARVEFPGKVSAEAQLQADVPDEQAWLAGLQPPPTDRYGGLPGSGARLGLKRTGFFHIEQVDGRQVLVTPEGNAFFQLGVCSALINIDDYTSLAGRRGIYEEIPSFDDPLFTTAYRERNHDHLSFYIANVIRKYGQAFSPAEHAQRMAYRLRQWGFNSGGAWAVSDATEPVVREIDFPYVAFLPLAGPKLPAKSTWDPFAEGLEAELDARFASAVAARASDPLLIGWFISNEPLIEDLPKVLPALRASEFAAKRRLMQMLREKHADIAAFNRAWGTEFPSFEEAGEASLKVTTPEAAADVQAFFELFLEARYSLVQRVLRRHDPNHLLIGDRWMPGTANNESLVRIAGKYLDVVSVNYYSYGIDRAYLDRIHAWSGGKPLLLSEFHFGSRDHGLAGGIRQVADQRERGLAYRDYVEQAAATGYVVGIQWFSAIDQATTGRFFEGHNGEANNIGLIDVTDRPYHPMLVEMMKTNYDLYAVIFGQRPPFAFDDPRFNRRGGGVRIVQVPRMVNRFVLDGSRTEWPSLPPERVGGDRLAVGEHAEGFDGSFRLAWDDRHLYVYVEVSDPTPMVNEFKSIWMGDSIELFTGSAELELGGNLIFGDRQILIRSVTKPGERAAVQIENAPEAFDIQRRIVANVDGRGYTAEMAIPLAGLGITPEPGSRILFDIAFNDGGIGRRQLVWNGAAGNSRDRSAWGRAEFTN